MSDTEKRQVLRYAELAFKAQRNELTESEQFEMRDIRRQLDMSHKDILELASKKLFPED